LDDHLAGAELPEVAKYKLASKGTETSPIEWLADIPKESRRLRLSAIDLRFFSLELPDNVF
jgi:hypothetical protein